MRSELASPAARAQLALSGAGAFYGSAFGWEIKPSEGPITDPYFDWSHNEDAVGGVVPLDHRFPPGTAAHWTVCFMVDDCVTACERATTLGGTVARKPMAVAAGWYARIADPSGAHFAVIELSPELRSGVAA